ncbi:tRNA-dependent cyclodipeptide synthase [Xenorhabdus griffiniae]|uniref:Cyclodipeptide synthase n=1 Tax=Xenorhabdus griffiniae TaxID=351672 RepID=A0ABY9XJ10_9GAMM|nr:tRNA-dependent cyclodipeptide synthase [Xenorhabdus griffiniae]MBD1227185.1 tRNA-dependent cyclodipeptide synthase [Xenorhabdus griffiniae]WMV72876.1 tRNA-dependent cyclodipeptide synthase [Xenorhabdus griffiniae]WNH02555.1 tRNA-dependent cyclodipeptide synthase [Xenorhabdus griffiniae]
MEGHVIFGVSPFNTKFSNDYVHKMLEWGFNNYNFVDVIHPFEEAKYLLMGCGTEENKARKKSRKEYYRIQRYVESFLKSSGYRLRFGRIIKFEDFYESDEYIKAYNLIKDEYYKFEDFRKICLEQSFKAIKKRKSSVGDYSDIDHNLLDVSVEYILKEVPFIIRADKILLSTSRISISYYDHWNVADYLYNSCRNLKPSKKSSLAIKNHEISEGVI